MNPEIKAEWIKALRSGKYEQGRGFLRKIIGGDEQFCCLGVLCDIAVNHGVIVAPTLGYDAYVYPDGDDEVTAVLPESVVTWAGLPNAAVTFPEQIDRYSRIWELNDEAGMTFDQIADMIEEYL